MVKTLRANLFKGVICAAQAKTMKHRRKVIGFNDQALSNCPIHIAPIARVPPQPGQGYPVNKRTGQTTGPSSNPPVRKDASRTRNQVRIKRQIRLVLVPSTVVLKLLFKCKSRSILEIMKEWSHH